MVEAIDVRPLLGVGHGADAHPAPPRRPDRARRPGPGGGRPAPRRPARRARRRRPLHPRRRRRRVGRPLRAVRRRHRAPRRAGSPAAGTSASTTMGGFRVTIDGEPVPASAWGSRQARLVCKRLAVAVDRPVPRDELAELLWPDELDPAKRSARLSVVLSNIRRVLGGGHRRRPRRRAPRPRRRRTSTWPRVHDAIAAGDDAAVGRARTGPVLPEDAYEDWAIAARRPHRLRGGQRPPPAGRRRRGDRRAVGRGRRPRPRHARARRVRRACPRAARPRAASPPDGVAKRRSPPSATGNAWPSSASQPRDLLET